MGPADRRSRPPNPAVSILIATLGRSRGLWECLDVVGEQAGALGAEIVLVLNGPRDAWRDAERRDLERRVTRIAFEEGAGKSRALNLGVRHCRGDVVALTDDDALPAPGWLEAITAPLLREDRPQPLVGCGGRVTPRYGRGAAPGWFVRLVESKPTSFLGPRHCLGSEPREYGAGSGGGRAPIGANCAYRRELFQRYRFDPTLGPNHATGMRGGEDVAFARRLLDDGYRLRYVPEAEVVHPVARERSTFPFACYGHVAQGVERVRLARSLGLRAPAPARLRRRLRRHRLLRPALWLLPVEHRVRRRLRTQLLMGMLAELEGRGDRALLEAREAVEAPPGDRGRPRPGSAPGARVP